MAGSRDTLANGSEVNSRGGCARWKWQLRDGVEGGRALTSTVKFTLEIELDYFHIAQICSCRFALLCAVERYVESLQ